MTNEEITIKLTKHNEEIASLKHRVDDVEISLDDLEATLKDSDFSDFEDFLDEEAAADANYLSGGGQ